jgi:hypothetical protein
MMSDEKWRKYPGTLSDEIYLDSKLVNERFKNRDCDLFSDEDDINVRVTDVVDNSKAEATLTKWLILTLFSHHINIT